MGGVGGGGGHAAYKLSGLELPLGRAGLSPMEIPIEDLALLDNTDLPTAIDTLMYQ